MACGEGDLAIPLLAKCYARETSGSRASTGSRGGAQRGVALEAIAARLTRGPDYGNDGGYEFAVEWLQLVAAA